LPFLWRLRPHENKPAECCGSTAIRAGAHLISRPSLASRLADRHILPVQFTQTLDPHQLPIGSRVKEGQCFSSKSRGGNCLTGQDRSHR
jgi:hypothetical protein